MFKRKLSALGYSNSENFDKSDSTAFRNLVIWLEDQKIRHYKIIDRENLRNIQDKNWPSVFSQYLKDVSCPYNESEDVLALDWLLGFAVRLEYMDDETRFKSIDVDNLKKSAAGPKVIQSNPLDNLDFNGGPFKKGVAELAKLLKVPEHPEHLITLKAISILIREKLSADALEKQQRDKKTGTAAVRINIDDTKLGFDTGSKQLNQACKIIRLLHINDLRTLQTKINEVIVAVQSITANPKTDTSLGKVGMK